MSRFLLLLLTTISFYSVKAQFKKGDVLIGGTLSYSSTKNSSQNVVGESKNSYGNFNISLGKAINENSLFGINLNYNPSTNSSNYGNGNMTFKNENYGIGVFYRMYKNLGKEFYLFGETGAGFNGTTTSTKDSTGNKISSGTGYGGNIYITPGIAYKISKRFFLELSIPQLFSAVYSNSKTKTGSETTGSTDQFYINANISSNPLNSLGFGLRLIL